MIMEKTNKPKNPSDRAARRLPLLRFTLRQLAPRDLASVAGGLMLGYEESRRDTEICGSGHC